MSCIYLNQSVLKRAQKMGLHTIRDSLSLSLSHGFHVVFEILRFGQLKCIVALLKINQKEFQLHGLRQGYEISLI